MRAVLKASSKKGMLSSELSKEADQLVQPDIWASSWSSLNAQVVGRNAGYCLITVLWFFVNKHMISMHFNHLGTFRSSNFSSGPTKIRMSDTTFSYLDNSVSYQKCNLTLAVSPPVDLPMWHVLIWILERFTCWHIEMCQKTACWLGFYFWECSHITNLSI